MSLKDQLQPGEEVLYKAEPARIGLVPPLLLAVAILAAGVVGWRQAGMQLPLAVAGVVLVLVLGWAGARYLALAANVYVLTDRRVLKQTGILGRSSTTASLDKINNVEHRQTFVERLLGYGDVEIDTASEAGMTVFPRIRQPLEFKREVLQAAEAYRGRLR
ncbi:MAG: PH domain-containing protein [Acidobacteriota bacterium]|nr:PH domain-containing protein [Acidobacteriota bacterium]